MSSVVEYIFVVYCFDYNGFKKNIKLNCTNNHNLLDLTKIINNNCNWYSGTTLYYNYYGKLIPFDPEGQEADWCGQSLSLFQEIYAFNYSINPGPVEKIKNNLIDLYISKRNIQILFFINKIGHEALLVLNIANNLQDINYLDEIINYIYEDNIITIQKDNYNNIFNFNYNKDNLLKIKINKATCIYCNTNEIVQPKTFLNEVKII